MNHQIIARELLRAWRGRRSQAALSRRLGYRSSVLFEWESGRREPTAAKAFAVAHCVGIDLESALIRFLRWPSDGPGVERLDHAEGVRWFLEQIRGNTRIVELAQRSGFSRYTIGRWLNGAGQPSLAEFLTLLDVTTLRLLDFIAVLVDPERLPSLREAWRTLERARKLAYEAPWSHAVLRALELEDYQRLSCHEPGFIARRIGMTAEEELRYLELLASTGQIRWCDGRWVPDEAGVVDTRLNASRSRELRAFWSEAAAERLRAGQGGEFSFNLFGVSNADLQRLVHLQRAYFAELRRIVAESQPVERVVLTNLQLFALDQPAGGDGTVERSRGLPARAAR